MSPRRVKASPAPPRRDIILGIETATPMGGVAIAGADGTEGELILRNARGHGERLLPAVDRLLDLLGLVAADLAGVAVSIGPGSFTGLRIGVAAAKGIAVARGIPLYGIPTCDVLAANASPGDLHVCPVIDARRGQVFFACYERAGGALKKTAAERLADTGDLPGLLPPSAVVYGIPPSPFRAALDRAGIPVADAVSGSPRPGAVAVAGARLLAAGRPSETDTLVPLYVRPSDAEEGRRAGG